MELESKIQAKIIAYAKECGFIPLKVIKCNINGCSDIILFKDSKTLFIEVKSETGKQHPLQLYFQKCVENKGFKYYLCRTLDEFKNILYLETF